MMRRVLGSLALAAGLALTVQPAAEAAEPASPQLTLANYTVTVVAPDAPATVCDYNEIHCGYIAIQATFAGFAKLTPPTSPFGPPEAEFGASADVTRIYGCANANGKRLHRYDTVLSEKVGFGTRRGSGFRFPRTGDTASPTTYAFLSDLQPGNCPVGTTAMTYKIVVRHVNLNITPYIPEIPAGTYKVPGRYKWVGAVPTPTAMSEGAFG